MSWGRMLVSPELLLDLLHLPPGSEVLGSKESVGMVEIYVRHADIPEAPPGRATHVCPLYRKGPDGVEFVEWNPERPR